MAEPEPLVDRYEPDGARLGDRLELTLDMPDGESSGLVGRFRVGSVLELMLLVDDAAE